MAVLWLSWPSTRKGMIALILVAVAARVLMLPFPVGDDIHRYVWEGKI